MPGIRGSNRVPGNDARLRRNMNALATAYEDRSLGNGLTLSTDRLLQIALAAGGGLEFSGGELQWASSLGATDNAILRADGTGGKTAQGSAVTIDDNGNLDLNTAKLILDADDDTYIYSPTDDRISFYVGAAQRIYLTPLLIRFNAIDLHVGQGNKITFDTDEDTYIWAASADDHIEFWVGGFPARLVVTASEATFGVDIKMEDFSIYLDDDIDSRIYAAADDDIRIAAAGADLLQIINSAGAEINVLGTAQLNTLENIGVYFDADKDTSIFSDGDDKLTFEVGAAHTLEISTYIRAVNKEFAAAQGWGMYFDADFDTGIWCPNDDDLEVFVGNITKVILTADKIDILPTIDFIQMRVNTLVTFDTDDDSGIIATADDVLEVLTNNVTRMTLTVTNLTMALPIDMAGNNLDNPGNIAAKGDIMVGTAADTWAPLSVGTDGQILSADSAEATGLKWIDA